MNIVNASAIGSLKDKTYKAVKELFEGISDNECSGQVERMPVGRKQACMIEMDATTGLGVHFTDQYYLVFEPVSFSRTIASQETTRVGTNHQKLKIEINKAIQVGEISNFDKNMSRTKIGRMMLGV